MNKYILLLCILLVSGCENGELVLSEEDRNEIKQNTILVGQYRHKLFVECMELSSKMPRLADDDVSDIVDECSTQAYSMSEYLKK